MSMQQSSIHQIVNFRKNVIFVCQRQRKHRLFLYAPPTVARQRYSRPTVFTGYYHLTQLWSDWSTTMRALQGFCFKRSYYWYGRNRVLFGLRGSEASSALYAEDCIIRQFSSTLWTIHSFHVP